jgi:hypothetical protein
MKSQRIHTIRAVSPAGQKAELLETMDKRLMLKPDQKISELRDSLAGTQNGSLTLATIKNAHRRFTRFLRQPDTLG